MASCTSASAHVHARWYLQCGSHTQKGEVQPLRAGNSVFKAEQRTFGARTREMEQEREREGESERNRERGERWN